MTRVVMRTCMCTYVCVHTHTVYMFPKKKKDKWIFGKLPFRMLKEKHNFFFRTSHFFFHLKSFFFPSRLYFHNLFVIFFQCMAPQKNFFDVKKKANI